ncbi:MAG: hypothetical protein ACPGVG_00600 [Mycobacterium sp.]
MGVTLPFAAGHFGTWQPRTRRCDSTVVPDIDVVAAEPALIGGSGVSIPMSLDGAIGPGRITLLDLGPFSLPF